MRAHGVKSERYAIVRRLGAGGMGVVYEAFDRETGDVCALKTISGLDAQSLYRFKHEFRSLADLSHPNLVRLHELVGASDSWFFTMELVDGCDFHTFITESAVASRRGLPIDGDEITATHEIEVVSQIRAAPVRTDGPTVKMASLVLPFDVERLKSSLAQLADALEALHAHG